jgi:hypothetical protein
LQIVPQPLKKTAPIATTTPNPIFFMPLTLFLRKRPVERRPAPVAVRAAGNLLDSQTVLMLLA